MAGAICHPGSVAPPVVDRVRTRAERAVERVEATRYGGPVLDVARRMATEFKNDRVTGLAGEIAYFTLLSLFPLVLLLAALLSSLDDIIGADLANDAEQAIVDGLSDVLTSEGDGLVNAVQQLFDRPSPGLLSIGLVFTLWAASRTFVAVVNALDVVHELEEQRPWLKVRLLGLALTLGTVVMVVVLLALVLIGPLLGTGQELAEDLGVDGGFGTAWQLLRVPVAAAVLISWAATIYHVVPHRAHRTRWRDDLPGALLAAAGAGLVTVGFRTYLDLAGGTNAVVGAVGGVLTAVLWIYLMAIVLLLGAELNDALAHRHGLRRSGPDDPGDAAGIADRLEPGAPGPPEAQADAVGDPARSSSPADRTDEDATT